MNLPKTIDITEFELTKEFEGYSKFLYKCTAGKLTIGWGRNLTDKGISIDEAELMFKNDIYSAIRDLTPIFPELPTMPSNLRIVLVDMMFNLGATKFRKFKKFIQAVKDGDIPEVKAQMIDSDWYKQVGNRGIRLVALLDSH